MRAIYGDATHPDTLAQAGAADAGNFILTSAGMADGREAIRNAKELNPGIHVLARAPYLRDLQALRDAGADRVVSAEGEVGLALTEMILQRLGGHARPDRPRARTRPIGIAADVRIARPAGRDDFSRRARKLRIV